MDGRRLKEQLKKKGMTSVSLADSLGVSAVTVSRWINGTRVPSLDMLKRISQILELDISELIDPPVGNYPPDYQNSSQKKDPAEKLGEVGLEFALRHNQQDYLRKGDAAGVCPGAQPLIDKGPLRPESFHAAVAIPVFKYSEIMSLGSDKVKPVGCHIMMASLFQGRDIQKIKILDPDIPFKMCVTGPISEGWFAVIDEEFAFSSGYVYLCEVDGLRILYRVVKTPDGNVLLSDDTTSKTLTPAQQKEARFKIVAVVRYAVPTDFKVLCQV